MQQSWGSKGSDYEVYPLIFAAAAEEVSLQALRVTIDWYCLRAQMVGRRDLFSRCTSRNMVKTIC